MAVRVTVNDASVAQFLRTDPAMQKALGIVAGVIEEQAQRVAPYGVSLSYPMGRPMRHGWYKGAFTVKRVGGGYQVWNEDPFAHLIEWGSVNNPTYAPMRTAITGLGFKFRERGKPEAGSE